MSFIFDALKKLEQEKGRIPSPDYLKDKFLKQISQSSELLKGDFLKNLSLKNLSLEKITQRFKKKPALEGEGPPMRTLILGVVTILVIVLFISGAFEAKKKPTVVISPSSNIPPEIALLSPTPALPGVGDSSIEIPGWEEGKPLVPQQIEEDFLSSNINPFSGRPRPKTLVERMGDPFQQPILLAEDGTPVLIDESLLEPSWEEEPEEEPEFMVAELDDTPVEESDDYESVLPVEEPVETEEEITIEEPESEPVEPGEEVAEEEEQETQVASMELMPEFDISDIETGQRSIKRSEIVYEPEPVEKPIGEEPVVEETVGEEKIPAEEGMEETVTDEEGAAEEKPVEEAEEQAVAMLAKPTPNVNVLAEIERRRKQILIEGIIYNRDPGRSFVLLRNLSTNSSTIVRVGEEFLGMKVGQINLKNVQFHFFDQTLVLKVD